MREDWIESELKELTTYQIGGDWGKDATFSDDTYVNVYCIRGTEFRNWKLDKGITAVPRKIKEKSFFTRKLFLNDILVEISGGGPEQPVGRTELIDNAVLKNFRNKNLVFTNFLRLLRPSNYISAPFLNLYLKYFYSTGKIIQYQAGSNNLRNLKFDQFLGITIPLPPLPEQLAIVKKTEQLFSALDASIADLKKAQEQLKIYRQAVLKKAFEDVESTIPLSEVGSWKGGGTPSTQKKEFWENGNIPWVSSQDVKSMYINNTERKITNIAIENSSTKWIDKDALLFVVRSGILRRIFPIAIANVDLCVNQDIQTVTLESNFIPEFLYWFLTGNELDIRHSCAKDGTTVESIDVYKLKNYNVPSCSIEQQRQIIKEIESRLSVCDAVEQQIKASLDKAEALRQSILKKAFAGSLLTQAELEICRKEPDYEPASVLLEKIKAEKQTGKKKTEKAITPTKPALVATGKVSTDIQAGLIAKVIRLHEEHPQHHILLTHIKCEKLSHLVEYHLQIPLGRQPVKDAAGPDDYKRLKAVEHRAKMAGYFSVQKNKIGYTYVSGKGIGKAITQFEKNLSEEQKQRVDQLLHLFLTFDLEQAEIVATVYAAWNNLLILGKNKPTDQEIVQEARYNWSDRKLGLEEHRFYKAIEWMQKDTVNLVPTGYGTLVDFPKKKK